MRNLQEQVKKAFFHVKKFENSRPLASNFKSFFSITRTFFSHSRSEQFWWQNTNNIGFQKSRLETLYFFLYSMKGKIKPFVALVALVLLVWTLVKVSKSQKEVSPCNKHSFFLIYALAVSNGSDKTIKVLFFIRFWSYGRKHRWHGFSKNTTNPFQMVFPDL